MKKNVTLWMSILSVSLILTACGSAKNYAEKLRAKNFKQKAKELKKEGWKTASISRTLELEVYEHYEKLTSNPNMEERIAAVSMCQSLNLCRANAINNVLREYADLAGSTVRGKIVSDMGNNASAMKPEGFDKFYGAYVRNVEKEIENDIKPSYAVYRENAGGGKEYRMVFIIDEEGASQSRKRAMQRALEETKLSIEYGLWVEKFVNEKPQKEEK